jgi:hypothetical protein
VALVALVATRLGGLAEVPQDGPRCADHALTLGQPIGTHTYDNPASFTQHPGPEEGAGGGRG